MAKVLAPRFELFRGLADAFAESDKCISETMRVEIRQASAYKGFAEDFANGCGILPMASFKTRHFKLTSRAYRDPRCREKRIVVDPEFFFLQIGHPSGQRA